MNRLYKSLTLLSLFIFFYSCNNSTKKTVQSETVFVKLDSLIQVKDYFSARDLYAKNENELSDFQRLRVEVFLDFAFNRPMSSAIKSDSLLKLYTGEMTDSLRYEVEAITHINYARRYEYTKAKESLEHVLANYPDFLSADEKENLENTLIIWTALQGQPKQKVIKQEDLRLSIIRDKVGLQNLLISKNGIEQTFVFDTGANISTITSTTASAFGVELLDGFFEVGTITGEKMLSQIGILPFFNLGSIKVKNAVFIVMPDEALAFTQIDYQINGILGFPVLEALGEITTTAIDEFIVPFTPKKALESNLALDFLTPLLFLQDSRGKGTFILDTGANSTMLFDTYYNKHKQELSMLKEVDYFFGGAGGYTSKKGVYTSIETIINSQKIVLDSIIVLKEPLKKNNHYLGNIGQDFLNQFETMTINFEHMYLLLE